MKSNKPSQIVKRHVIVFYDTWCPICTKSMKILMRLDWFKKLKYESTRDKMVLDQYHLDEQQVEKRMHTVILKNDKVESGIDSILRIAKQIPLLWLSVPFLKVMIWVGVGEKLYDWLASKRKILPVGSCEGAACRIPDKTLD